MRGLNLFLIIIHVGYIKLGYANTENYDKLKRHVELPPNFTNQDANEFHALLDNFGKNYFNASIEQRYHFLDHILQIWIDLNVTS